MNAAPSCVFARYFCDSQHETLGECLYRRYRHLLAGLEVLVASCISALLDAAFVVNRLALSEMDFLCRAGGISAQEPSPACRVQETRPGPAFSVPYNPYSAGKICTSKRKPHSTHLWINFKKTITLVACKKGFVLFRMLWKIIQQNPNPERNYSDVL